MLWVAATLMVAALVHTATLWMLPRVAMARALARIGASNVMHYASRPDATSRAVVRPSPDLLYASCPFDLSNGPVRLLARVPHTTYWSVSAYDAATNNFFVRDERQIAADSIEIVALRPGVKLPPLGSVPERIVLIAPTDHGMFLVRLLIDDAAHLDALRAIQHEAACGSVASTARHAASVRGAAAGG